MSNRYALSVATGVDVEWNWNKYKRYTGHTQKNGAVSKVYILLIPPFFCVCPV
jgi:hypothetical protein